MPRFNNPFHFPYRLVPEPNNDEKQELSVNGQRSGVRPTLWYRRAFLMLLAVNTAAVLLLSTPKNAAHAAIGQPNAPSPLTVLTKLEHNFPLTFQPDERFEHPELQEVNPWQSINPPGRGFIEMSNPDDPTESNHYAISMFHQLHCLAALQSAFTMLTSPQDSSNEHENHLVHLGHCFDYLRQAIMCAGDTTLEPAHIKPEANGTSSRSVNGWGVTHSCRNYGEIWEYAREHRYRNDSGIL